jgi:hypothetical protein
MLSKPFSPRQLLTTVNEVLGLKNAALPAAAADAA